METWTARSDDRPDLNIGPERRASWPWLLAAAFALGAMGFGYYLYLTDLRKLPPEALAPSPAPISAPAPATAPGEAPPAVRHPVAAAPEPSLPTLENSDAMARDSLIGLLGGKAFDELVIPVQLVRRIVATVDNLPRPTAPRRAIPLTPVPGAFVADAANGPRYAPYIRVLEAVDSGALVQRYVRAYPLFQRAYEELGFPGRHFNDRLVEAIDDLLATPEPAAAPEVIQAKVLYEFADPELEKRSAGQKVLLRMGTANAQRVKAKLREIRRELLAASERR
jgi:hypothetical protein